LRKEGDLCPDEGHVAEVLQLLHHVVEDVPGLVMVVALVGLHPARIIVRVRHEDHLQQNTNKIIISASKHQFFHVIEEPEE
jgi:hypothetical protein